MKYSATRKLHGDRVACAMKGNRYDGEGARLYHSVFDCINFSLSWSSMPICSGETNVIPDRVDGTECSVIECRNVAFSVSFVNFGFQHTQAEDQIKLKNKATPVAR